jgi:hypothetical protein
VQDPSPEIRGVERAVREDVVVEGRGEHDGTMMRKRTVKGLFFRCLFALIILVFNSGCTMISLDAPQCCTSTNGDVFVYIGKTNMDLMLSLATAYVKQKLGISGFR